MGSSTISLGLGLGGGKSATSSGAGGGGGFLNEKSVSFDGSDDYATATLGSQVFDGDFSISFWAKPVTSSHSFCTLMQLGNYSGGFRLYRYPPSGLFAWWNGITGTSVFGNFGSSSANAWMNMTIVRSGTAMTVFINGSQVATQDNSHSAQSYTSTAYDISFTQYPYEGFMDEVALWDSALTSSNVTAIYNSRVPADLTSLSPVNWWRMGDNDGGSGTTVTDQGSGSNNVTLVNGPTFSTEVPLPLFSRKSVSFDGTDDILITDESNLATSGDCTISLWFNSGSIPGSGAFDYMFSLADGRATGKDRAVGIYGYGSYAQIVANTYASGWNTPFTNTTIYANRWYHVAVIFTSGSAQVYFEGADKGSKTVSTNTIAYSNTVIGTMPYSSANQFNGLIDEVSVFHSALSSSNITSIYNNGAPGDISSLSPKGWWRNGDGTGDTNSSGGAPANTDTVGTVANQGSVNTGSGQGNMTGTNGPTYSNTVPS